jgi:hypothetical protein
LQTNDGHDCEINSSGSSRPEEVQILKQLGTVGIEPPHVGCYIRQENSGLGLALGFTEAGDAVAFFPLTAFFEKFQAFKALQNIPFSAQSGGCAQAAML